MPRTAKEESGRDDVILPNTRRLSGFIIPFLVVAFFVLYPDPTRTKDLFAWEMKPTMTPMVLASAYIGGAYFFLQVLLAKRWHTIGVGFVPVALFATSLAVATVLHWDKFNHQHLAFWLWSGLYFTTPILVVGVWLDNRRRDPGVVAGDLTIPPIANRIIGTAGLAALCLGAFIFVFPTWAVQNWPWTLTPLTARVMAAVLMLGVAGIGMYRDSRWSAARSMLNVERLMVALILLAAVRARDQMDTTRPLTWALGFGLVFVLVGSTALDIQMRRRARSQPAVDS